MGAVLPCATCENIEKLAGDFEIISSTEEKKPGVF